MQTMHQQIHKHWRAHREDIKAARATRKHDAERMTCVCGTSINVRHRTKHCQSKRHLSVVAVLRQYNALSPIASAPIIPASTAAAERERDTSQQEFVEVIAAAERELAAWDALREQRRSLLRSPDPPSLRASPTPTTALTVDAPTGEHRVQDR